MSGPRLFGPMRARMSPAMPARPALLAAAGLTLALALAPLPRWAVAASKTAKPAAAATGPKAIGHFDDWTAATNKEAGQTVCYAFTRAANSTPAVPGRSDVVLTVTERPGGAAARDAVAISAGFAYAANASVTVNADPAPALDFYTAQRSAFARDGHAAVAAFQKARQAVAHSPGPKGATVTDTFSLRGFSGAYAAIQKACPPGKSGG